MEQQIVNGLMLGGVYVLIAVAFTLGIGILNFLNFSIPGIFMLGGMFTWALFRAGWHWLPVVAAVLAVGAAAALLVERFTYRWMRSSDHFVPLVSSMAFLILFEQAVLIHWGSDLQRVDSPFGDASVRVAGLLVGIPQLLSLILAIGLTAGLVVIMNRTRAGRALRTIAESPETATLLGVDVGRIGAVVFLISGLFTVLGGVLFAINYVQVHPLMGEAVALKGISAMIIGGMGNVWGAVLGGLIIGIAETLAVAELGADVVDIVVYGLLLLILFFRPQGLLGGRALGKGKF